MGRKQVDDASTFLDERAPSSTYVHSIVPIAEVIVSAIVLILILCDPAIKVLIQNMIMRMFLQRKLTISY